MKTQAGEIIHTQNHRRNNIQIYSYNSSQNGYRKKKCNCCCLFDACNINERGLSKNHLVKIENFIGASAHKINQEIDVLFKTKPNILIVYARTNNLTKQINLLNSFKKSLKKHNEISLTTELTQSDIILRKEKASLRIDTKIRIDTNSCFLIFGF